jgi:hypothetical protein
MARMSDAQLKKLTPAERKAREKRLAYGRKYDASKRDGKSVKRAPAAKKSVASVASDARVSAKLKALVAELESVEERAAELIKQIREIE